MFFDHLIKLLEIPSENRKSRTILTEQNLFAASLRLSDPLTEKALYLPVRYPEPAEEVEMDANFDKVATWVQAVAEKKKKRAQDTKGSKRRRVNTEPKGDTPTPPPEKPLSPSIAISDSNNNETRAGSSLPSIKTTSLHCPMRSLNLLSV